MIFLQQWGAILVSIFASTSIVIGAHMALKPTAESRKGMALTRIFAFGAGAFFTAVCLDFLPDTWSAAGDKTPYWLFIGALVMWGATHLSDSLFNHDQEFVASGGETLNNSPDGVSLHTVLRFTPVSAIVLTAALSFHTFLEGTAVALSFHHLSWNTLGFSLSMILHKLPEGVLWGLALGAIFPRDRLKIRRLLIIPALCTIAGALLGVWLAKQASVQLITIATGLVAGAMLYISFAEVMPALRDSPNLKVVRIWFLSGVFIMVALNSLSQFFAG